LDPWVWGATISRGADKSLESVVLNEQHVGIGKWNRAQSEPIGKTVKKRSFLLFVATGSKYKERSLFMGTIVFVTRRKRKMREKIRRPFS
jgi:hypothetical protein